MNLYVATISGPPGYDKEGVWFEASFPSDAMTWSGHMLRGELVARCVTQADPTPSLDDLLRIAPLMILTLYEYAAPEPNKLIGKARVIPQGIKQRNLNRPRQFKPKGAPGMEKAFEEYKSENWSGPRKLINKVQWERP